MFSDDIVFVNESRKGVIDKLEQRREGLHVSDTKEKYFKCKFNNKRSNDNVKVTFVTQCIPLKDNFKYQSN